IHIAGDIAADLLFLVDLVTSSYTPSSDAQKNSRGTVNISCHYPPSSCIVAHVHAGTLPQCFFGKITSIFIPGKTDAGKSQVVIKGMVVLEKYMSGNSYLQPRLKIRKKILKCCIQHERRGPFCQYIGEGTF